MTRSPQDPERSVDDLERNEEAEPTQAEREETLAPPPSPSIANGSEQHVDPRSIDVARLIGLPLTGGISVISLVALTVGCVLARTPAIVYLPLLAVVLLLGGLTVIIAYRFPAVRHRYLRYRVEPDGLCIQHGVFWRTTIWIPITRVQHTDVSQGPLQRKYHLATLTVHTAGTEGAAIPLPGLEHGVATRLSEHLRPEKNRDGG